MKISIPHSYGQSAAITRVKDVLAQEQKKIQENAQDVQTSWSDNVLSFAFSAQGTHIEGTLTVEEKTFELYAKLPLTLRLFEGTIERMIKAEVEKMRL